MEFLWMTEGGNFTLTADDREHAVRKVIQSRIQDNGESVEEAIAHFRKNDQLVGTDGVLEQDTFYLGTLPEDL